MFGVGSYRMKFPCFPLIEYDTTGSIHTDPSNRPCPDTRYNWKHSHRILHTSHSPGHALRALLSASAVARLRRPSDGGGRASKQRPPTSLSGLSHSKRRLLTYPRADSAHRPSRGFAAQPLANVACRPGMALSYSRPQPRPHAVPFAPPPEARAGGSLAPPPADPCTAQNMVGGAGRRREA